MLIALTTLASLVQQTGNRMSKPTSLTTDVLSPLLFVG